MRNHTILLENAPWTRVCVGDYFQLAERNSCTEKSWDKLFRKTTVDSGVDVDNPEHEIFFEPTLDKGYNVVEPKEPQPMMDTARELTAHKVNGLNEALRIFVLDQPGHGGASHEYTILIPYVPQEHDDSAAWAEEIRSWSKWRIMGATADVLLCVNAERHRAVIQRTMQKTGTTQKPTVYLEFFDAVSMAFQNGPIKESGINGISQEALIAVLIDRLEGFQSGQFKCHDNQVALDSLQNARLWLHKRTMDRVARGVEGTTKA